MIYLLLLMAGCFPKQAPPVLFPNPIPTIEEPDLEELPGPELDDCPAAVSMNPGKPLPLAYYVDGQAQCRATLLPPSMVPALMRDAELSDYWADRAVISHEYRQRDRVYATGRYEVCVDDLRVEKRESYLLETVLFLAVPSSLFVGILLGALAVDSGQTIITP